MQTAKKQVIRKKLTRLPIRFIFDMYNFIIPFMGPIEAVYKVISFGAYTLMTGSALRFVDELGIILMYSYRTKNEGRSDVRLKKDYMAFLKIRYVVWIIVLIYRGSLLSYQI